MLKFLGGATLIQGGTSIPESRVPVYYSLPLCQRGKIKNKRKQKGVQYFKK